MRDDLYDEGTYCGRCGLPIDLCDGHDPFWNGTWEDDGLEGWDEVEEDRESAMHRDDARFYEEDS